MVERGVVIKQKHGRNVVYRAAGQQPQAPCAPEFALLKPRPMTTIPVREGGVIMPTTSSTASVAYRQPANMSRAMKWYERPSGRLIHAVLSTGTTGTATELAVLAGIAETSAQRICKLMVCCGDGHVCGNRARKGNGPPPNV